MRKRYLVPVLLCCCLLAACLLACADESDGQSQSDATTTTATESTTTTTTTLAPATWELITPTGDLPPGRLGGSTVYLADSNTMLLFGGYDGSTYYNDLWSYDLNTETWGQLGSTSSAPPGRASQAMAYDPVAGQLFIFGGYDGSTYYNDLWSYDLTGESWSSVLSKSTMPSKRYGHSLVYHPDSARMLLFGGYDGRLQYADTWSYDPATNVWTDLNPGGTSPTGRDSHTMAYDSSNKVFILFGGWSTTNMFDDTWAYDPAANAWTPLNPVSGLPAARALHQMVYDSSIEKFVLFGGGTSSSTFSDTWLFDLDQDAWTPVESEGEVPPARAGLAMAYDASARQVLMFGGTDGVNTYLNDLWRLRR